MGKLAFIFPGQGAQYVGMGKDIAAEYESANKIYEEASEALGFDIKDMIFNSDEETLKITENTQPTILTASVACMQPLIEKGIKPDYVAGLSLGEYTAHVASNTIGFKDAVLLVKKRGKLMQEAVPLGVGTMAVIMGLDNDIVIECCSEASQYGIVEPANFNCPGQIVVAGEVAAIEKVTELCKAKGARRAMLLPVSAPFHCSLLKTAGEKLAVELKDIILSDIQIPVVTNVTAECITDKGLVKDILVKQVSSSVLWENCIRTMINNGVETFVEIGPGMVLSGFVKKISKAVRVLNVENLESLDNTLKQLI